ncbi:hypothetical protein [Thiolapillus sp.]
MFDGLVHGLIVFFLRRCLLSGLLLAGTGGLSAAPHQGPVQPPVSGYGSWGDEVVALPLSFDFTTQGYVNRVSIYHPENQAAAAPAVFFAPGWNIPCPAYAELFNFLASKGYVAVCDEYHTDIGVIGAQLRDAFMEAANRYPDLIDTSRIGLAGHSSGAGLLGSLTYDLVRNRNWGGNGVFIFSSAPWIDFDMTDAMLADFPQEVKLIVHTYEDDTSTDMRTYIQQFEPLPIPDSEKEFIMLRPVSVGGYDYLADHRVIATGDGNYGVFDAMDDYGVFRILEALADYSFTGSAQAWQVALGNGADEQIEMGALRDLVSTDDPRPIPGKVYDYPCDYSGNPRRTHCADYDDELPAAVLQQPVKHRLTDAASPLFVWEPVITAESYYLQIRPLLDNGEPDWGTSFGVGGITPGDAGCGDEVAYCQYQPAQALPRDSRYVWWIKADSAQRPGVWSRRGYFTLTLVAFFTDGFE